MNKYNQLAKSIILEILKNLHIVRQADSFYYHLKTKYYSQEIDRNIHVTDDTDKIFKLLRLDQDELEKITCENSAYEFFRKSRFYGKDFMEVIRVSQANPLLRLEARCLWKLCTSKGYNNMIKVEEPLYVKMIDRFCESKVESVLRFEAAARIRQKYLSLYLSIPNISEWTRYKRVPDALDLRTRFFEDIKTYYPGHKYPIEQYLSDATYQQAKSDLLSFVKNEDLKEFEDAHLST